MKLIECNNLSLSYENTSVADNISFDVSSGDYLCIVGENGSGKSTLVKTILGLHSPSDGSIVFEEGFSSKNIGYLPQQTTAQKDFPASVWEVVLSGCLSKKKHIFFSKKEKKIADDNMKKLDILPLKNRSYRELSGGQQQRVLLARALCACDGLLLLDEPAASLDPVVTGEFYSLIERLNREEKLTVIMVTHDLLYAASHASHILHVRKSDSFFGKSDDYINSSLFNTLKGGQDK